MRVQQDQRSNRFRNFFSLILISALTAGSLRVSAYGDPLEVNRLYNQGVENYSKGNTTQAINMFEKASKEDPKFIDAYYNLGSLYFQTKDYDRSRKAFQRVVALNPGDSQAKYNLALSLEKLKRHNDAIAILSQIPSSDRKYAQASEKIEQLRPLAKEQARRAAASTPRYSNVESKKKVASATSAAKTKKRNDAENRDDTRKTVETFASGFFGPTGMAMSGDGTMYVANYSKNLIYRVTPRGEKTIYVQGEGLHGPLGLALDANSGVLYVANYLENNIMKINTSGKVSVLASGLNKPYNLLLDSDRKILYISEQETNTVSKVQLSR